MLLAAVCTLLPVTPAPAADELPGHLKTCMSLRRDAERLACYDKAVALLQNATDAPPPSAENMFGANTAITSGQTKGETRREELREITGVVASLRRADDGMMVLELDNGQVWRQQDSDVSLTIDTGDSVTVSRASLGTFRIADKRGRSARFKRLR
jgi:hypothetical protein